MKNNNSGSAGLGTSGVLTLIFLVLKLIDVIDWSWWWVFSPLLIESGLAIAILVVVGIVRLIGQRRKKRKGC
jgi:hypothetical protein